MQARLGPTATPLYKRKVISGLFRGILQRRCKCLKLPGPDCPSLFTPFYGRLVATRDGIDWQTQSILGTSATSPPL